MRPLSSTGGFKAGVTLKKCQKGFKNGLKPGLDRWGKGSKPLKKWYAIPGDPSGSFCRGEIATADGFFPTTPGIGGARLTASSSFFLHRQQ
jgi:hypothetical protein